jgi:DNA replication protein DnaC
VVVDEVGYLSFDPRNADLLFQVISRRYEKKSLVPPPTLRSRTGPRSSRTPPAPPPSSIALIHHADVLAIEGESYRLRDAEKRAGQKR